MKHTSVSCLLLISRLWRPSTSLFVLTALAVPAVQAQSTGTVTGAVYSAGTRNALQGATVSIPSLNRVEFTDSVGRYTFSGVPAGAVDVVVSYTGFTEARQKVSVGAGASAQTDFDLKSSEVLTMQAFTVDSVREGQALSLTQQRNAENIKNVTSFDEWGVLPTQNVAELLTRLPGIMVAQMDEDGLMMSVSIGGQPGGNAGYTRMNIDGMSATGVGGDGRTATMHSFSGSMYEQVEVIAGQTPDKRSDGLGGQLNLITASPLSISGRRRIDFTGSGRWFPSWSKRNDMLGHHPLRPDLSFSYREVFDVGQGHRNLGVQLGVGYQEIVNPHDFDVNIYQNTTAPVAWLQDYQRSSGINDRFVSGFNARVDYRLSQSTKISVRFLYNGGSEPFFQYTHVNPFGSANLSVYDPVTNAAGSIMPGFTANRTEIRPTTTTSGVTGVLVGADRMRLDLWKVSFTSKNPTGTVAVDHNFGKLKIDHAYRWSQTHWDSGAGRGREAGELQLRTKDALGFVLDNTNPNGQVFTQTAGPSVYDAASYTPFIVTAKNTSTQPVDQTSAVFIKRDTVTNTNEVSANVNASYLMPTEFPLTFKTGLDTVNRRVNTFLPSTRRWYGVVGSVIPTTSVGLVPLTEFERQNGGRRLPVFDPASVSNTLDNTALWTEDVNFNAVEKYRSTRIVEEGVDAGYVQGTLKLGRFTALGGVRGEWVSTETFFYVAAAAAKRTTVAAEPDPIKRAIRDYTPSSIDSNYHKFFPSLHLAYDLTKDLKIRGSWSTSYGRPRLQDMVGIPTAVDPVGTNVGTVTIGNPGLKPAMAKNIDFRIDYNIGATSFFSARFYKKNISDYVGSAVRSGTLIADGPDNGFGGQYVGYELIEPKNIGTTESKGMELDYRQRLSFLPGALKGLFFRANYTDVRTSAVFNGIAYAPGQVVGSAGQWYVPRTYNLGLQYFYGKFGANFDVNYTAQFPIAFGLTSLGSNQFREKRTVMNTGVSYQVRPELTVFLNVNNLSEEGLETYTSIESRHRQFYVLPRSIKFGVTGRF